MKKRLISILLATAMTATLISGCGSGSGGSSAETDSSSGDDEVVTLTYWGWDSNFYEPMFEAYEAEHPNVHFEPTAVEYGEMITKAQQALASGSELPTMLALSNNSIATWKDMDICEDLTKYGFEVDNYLDSLASMTVTDDGAVIGIEESINPAAVAYKRDLALEYFGTDDPDELYEMFSSYDAYVEKGKEVHDKSNGEVFLFHSGQTIAEWFYFASDIPTMEDDTVQYTDKMGDTMDKLIELRDVGAVDTYQNGTPEANATYADDKHIFYPCPNWAITFYIMENDPDGAGNWGIMPSPVNYNSGGSALAMTKSATEEQKEAAYDFMIWAFEGDGAEIARDKVGYITPYLEKMNDPEWTKTSDEINEFFGGQDVGEVFYQVIAPDMTIVPTCAWEETIISVRNDVAQQLVDNTSMTLDEGLDLGKEHLEQLITVDNLTIN